MACCCVRPESLLLCPWPPPQNVLPPQPKIMVQQHPPTASTQLGSLQPAPGPSQPAAAAAEPPSTPRPAARARSAAASLPAEELLERDVSPEQAKADLAAIRNMWELAAVYEFLSTFKYWLNFSQLYPLHDLEEAIVKSPGPGVSCCPHNLLNACCLAACHHPPHLCGRHSHMVAPQHITLPPPRPCAPPCTHRHPSTAARRPAARHRHPQPGRAEQLCQHTVSAPDQRGARHAAATQPLAVQAGAWAGGTGLCQARRSGQVCEGVGGHHQRLLKHRRHTRLLLRVAALVQQPRPMACRQAPQHTR